MVLPFERKLPIILSFVFLMLAMIGFFSYRGTVSIKEAREWEKRSLAIRSNLDNILSSIADLETGLSGFMVTGNETYFEPFKSGKAALKRDISELRTLLADDPDRLAGIDALNTLLNQKIDYEGDKADVRRRDGYEKSVYLLAETKGTALTESIRSSVDKLKNDEIASLQAREQNLDRGLSVTILFLILSSIAGVAALIAANVLIVQEIRKRRTAEGSLADANKGLEQKVNQRTEELQIANRDLQMSSVEREELLIKEQAARQEAEIANRLRDEFIATISHELRTPLNSILGWARLLRSGSLDEGKSNKAVETIIKNSETQNRLIEDLMDAARVISGKLVLELEPVDIEEIVMHSIETIRPAAEAKEIRIEVDLDTGPENSSVNADKHRLNQVVWNLLTNAVKFTPTGGRVLIGLTSEDGFVELKVTDSGAGINPDFLPKVFERFRQDKATMKKSGGLGLGLAVVRNLVEMHGGSVSAESEGENRGATFIVRIPARISSASVSGGLP